MNRPDLRNYSYNDLCMVKNFESLSLDEKNWFLNHTSTHNLSVLGRFGHTIDFLPERDEKGYQVMKYVPADFIEPITETSEELLKMDLPISSCDSNGKFSCKEDKWREGKFDLGYEPEEQIPLSLANA